MNRKHVLMRVQKSTLPMMVHGLLPARHGAYLNSTLCVYLDSEGHRVVVKAIYMCVSHLHA